VRDDMHKGHLAQADAHIARSLPLIAKQQALIERLERDGFDTCEAQRLLALFEDALELMRAHSELILRAPHLGTLGSRRSGDDAHARSRFAAASSTTLAGGGRLRSSTVVGIK